MTNQPSSMTIGVLSPIDLPWHFVEGIAGATVENSTGLHRTPWWLK